VRHRFLPVCLLAALTLLGGCTQYREVPPQTAEGQACVRKCSEQASECRQRAEESYKGFKGLYDIQYQSYQSYQSCLHNSGDPNLQSLCPKPTAPSGPDTSICSDSYKSCFVDCGGQYEKVE